MLDFFFYFVNLILEMVIIEIIKNFIFRGRFLFVFVFVITKNNFFFLRLYIVYILKEIY